LYCPETSQRSSIDVVSQSVHIAIRRKMAHPHNQWGLHTYREYE